MPELYDLVELVPHDTSWGTAFKKEAQLLSKMLNVRSSSIKHIGSTAIPGIVSKPLIDIIVGTTGAPDPDKFTPILDPAGYIFIKNDPVANRCLYVKNDPTTGMGLFNLHFADRVSAYYLDKLTFHKYLLAHKSVTLEYEALKIKLAKQFPQDRLSYAHGKADFVNKVLELARGSEHCKKFTEK